MCVIIKIYKIEQIVQDCQHKITNHATTKMLNIFVFLVFVHMCLSVLLSAFNTCYLTYLNLNIPLFILVF